MKELNNVVKIRGKIRGLHLSTKFLKECIFKRVSPKFIMKRMEKSKLKYSPSIERAFLNDEICKNQAKLKKLKLKLSEIWPATCKFLPFLTGLDFPAT